MAVDIHVVNRDFPLRLRLIEQNYLAGWGHTSPAYSSRLAATLRTTGGIYCNKIASERRSPDCGRFWNLSILWCLYGGRPTPGFVQFRSFHCLTPQALCSGLRLDEERFEFWCDPDVAIGGHLGHAGKAHSHSLGRYSLRFPCWAPGGSHKASRKSCSQKRLAENSLDSLRLSLPLRPKLQILGRICRIQGFN
jgi:hypothetical protein